ncbi:putative ABC-type branched-chain amino acid transport system, permease component, livH [Thiomonas arsenitoxydans]|uniref:ABC-type branched-chain amino acid transport system, permease component, livH n=1 Tax=Thiomonas arsenitoxydans (strain DSM 22701 / CIP 110005 / 3As) TaxID=426114 RepID=D6CQQ7_THIA3|nr:branched-chain amino acid ABC transporter permease [Thiomonas arsenitoxydans]CAZ86948.1 putative ABC-type branched-chain amino acid transport system, permease component, livH [Thiomonas arsenitoxydans]CQR27871.1 putative ABC-type branched-chain amino acid transport system, permease component, livH [Thiomonas arsenitoxydans]CQR30268.1 putative ABC-type branched-chain amino acid transport system, permease component, livH [Thiomonas arsenitoxydans]CQR32122.1 putative ABC-type branched-chain ami
MNLVLVFNTFNGLITGAFYALLALGLALILGLNNTINFAQGAFMALAAYFAYTLEPSLGFWGALAVAPLLAGALGLVVEVFLIRRLYKRDPLYSLLLTFGLALIMQDVIRTVWGANGVPLSIPESLGHPLSQTYFFLTGYRLFVVAVALVGTAVLFAVLRYTRLGIRIRAGNADLETVSALGVNIYLLRTANFVIGIVFAGVAGILAAGQLGLEPTMGDGLLMPAFVAIVVGGVGSLLGSLLGGLLIGVASGITTAYFPAASEAVIYLIMGLMLVVRPRGLMGQEGLFE